MIRLRVFGSLQLSSDDRGEIRSVLAQPKRVAILAYMAASTAAYHRRDRLLAMFWPEQDDARAREALNTAISFLRREIGRDAILSRGVDEIGLNPEACWSDVAAFRSALDARAFDEALAHYRGDLLEGFYVGNSGPFEEWVERARAQLRSEAARAARAVAEERERSQHYTTAISSARRALELSADDERVLRQLLELLDRLGDRAGALLAYETFERRLAEEFATEPSAETRALIGQIRARQAIVAVESATSSDAVSPAAPSRWVVEREIGRGGMATVYLARDTVHDRPVALKVMRPDLLSSGAERFLREIRITARLAHPRILPLIDSGMREGAPYLVTPYVDGESLRDRLNRGTIPTRQALELAIGIAEALDYAHRSGVIHCDIKPENILLADGQVVVADFGVSRALSDDVGTSEIAGSRAYMSPEQLDPNVVLDARSDLYSLACVLVETICGTIPRDARHAGEILERHGGPVSLHKLADDCLSAERERRPSSAALVLDRLRAVVRETDVELTRAGATTRPKIERPSARRRTRRRFAVIGGAVVGIGLLASPIWLRSPATLISSGKLAPHDTIILADFQVAGPDSNSAAALTNLLRRDFVDSKAVSLMSAGDMSSALKRMRLPAETPITPKIGLEMAQREGKHAVIVPVVTPLSSGRVLTIRLIESATGNELTSVTRRTVNADRELPAALAEASQMLRRRIGESTRHAKSAPYSQRRLYTTTSLEAARLLWPSQAPRTTAEKIAAMRAAIRRDSAFAYAWMNIGTMLSWMRYRSAVLDSAFSMAYRFRDNVTLMENAQVSSLYFWNIQRDRRAARQELELAVQADTTIPSVVPLNITEIMVDVRDFERAEAFSRRIEAWKTVGSAAAGAVVQSQLAQGKFAAAESTVDRARSRDGRGGIKPLILEQIIALTALRFDSAEALLEKLPTRDVTVANRAGLYRLRGRLAEAHQMDDWLDSSLATAAATAGARFDPTSGRALRSAREALWLAHDTAAAIAALDRRWRAKSQIFDIQDRIDGMSAAGLYAAAGKQAMARELVAAFEAGADTIAKRAYYEYREAALGETALADGKFSDAMRLFRASDLAPDGLPASACATCVLPHLARVAERAGWPDSARVFWEAYVIRPAISRLETDQWFLATAYTRLAAFATERRDSASAAKYRDALVGLRARTVRVSPSSH